MLRRLAICRAGFITISTSSRHLFSPSSRNGIESSSTRLSSIHSPASYAEGPVATQRSTVAMTHPPAELNEYSAIFIHNTDLKETKITAAEFLTTSPRGAYTTARTVGRKCVFEFEFHVQRLADSIDLMIKSDDQSSDDTWHADIRQAGKLRPKIVNSLQLGLTEFQRRNDSFKGEVKITALITWSRQSYDLFIHLSPLPAPPQPPIKVEIRGQPRSNAAAKDSEWVRQRKVLEDTKPADVNEILLMTSDGFVMEGMTSNFFVIQQGKLFTAQEGVLLGTVRQLVLEVCRNHGIQVELRPPNVSDLELWEGAFISSTSRLVLPVNHLVAPLQSGQETVSFKESIVEDISKWVSQEVANSSSTILY